MAESLGEEAKFMSGGHSLLPMMKLRFATPEHIIDISKIEGLSYIKEEGDVLIAISGSGNSPNVVKACEYAGEIGMKTAALTGRDGGKLKSLCDLSVIAPVEGMEQIEDIHMLWEHCIICTLRNVIDKEV